MPGDYDPFYSRRAIIHTELNNFPSSSCFAQHLNASFFSVISLHSSFLFCNFAVRRSLRCLAVVAVSVRLSTPLRLHPTGGTRGSTWWAREWVEMASCAIYSNKFLYSTTFNWRIKWVLFALSLAPGLGDSFDWASYLMEGIEFPTFSDDESEEVCALMMPLVLQWCANSVAVVCQ